MKDKIEIVIPTSPAPGHPSTELIESVVKSVRFHLPESKIHIACDGIRKSVEHRREQYEEYKTNLVNASLPVPVNIVVFDSPKQQSGMLRSLLDHVITAPVILFVEHDCILSKDFINWESIVKTLVSGEANTVRFYWRDRIHPEHEYLMHGETELHGAKYIKTTQYSGWPHLCTADFYRHMLDRFYKSEPEMLESLFYGPICNAPWEEYKTMIYSADDGNVKFFSHEDGRGADPKEW